MPDLTLTQSTTLYLFTSFLGTPKPKIFSSSKILSLSNLISANLKFCVVILRVSSTLIDATLSDKGIKPDRERANIRRSHTSSFEEPTFFTEFKP